MVCFWANLTRQAEFESNFTYAAVDVSLVVGTPASVVVVTYDSENCSIPDLGPSGFATVPASPIVSISLSGLKIQFEVTAQYLRGQTGWSMSCNFWFKTSRN